MEPGSSQRMGRLLHKYDALYIHNGNAASPGIDRNIGTAEGKMSALQWNNTDIEDAFWRNPYGIWAELLLPVVRPR
jgi:hypothetical protein